MRLVMKASQLGFTFQLRKPVEHPGDRGGKFYYDEAGKVRYGDRPVATPAPAVAHPAPAPTPPPTPAQIESAYLAKLPEHAKTVTEYRERQAKNYEVLEASFLEVEHERRIARIKRSIESYTHELENGKPPKKRREGLELWIRLYKESLEKPDPVSPAEMQRLRESYIETVKKALSTGLLVPREVIAQRLEFTKARDARERYEKGVHTSFANVSAAVNDTMQAERGYKVKRQDGKPISQKQMDEIAHGMDEIEAVLGPLRDQLRSANVTIAHTNGRHPFLSDAGGMYSTGEKTVTVGIRDFFGHNIPSLAHELAGHWLDYAAGSALAKKTRLATSKSGKRRGEVSSLAEADAVELGTESQHFLREARRLVSQEREVRNVLSKKLGNAESEEEKVEIQRTRVVLGPYWYEAREVFARLVEQYVAYKTGHGGWAMEPFEKYCRMAGYWTKQDFEKLVPRLEQQIGSRMKVIGAEPAFVATPASSSPVPAAAIPTHAQPTGPSEFERVAFKRATFDQRLTSVEAMRGESVGLPAAEADAAAITYMASIKPDATGGFGFRLDGWPDKEIISSGWARTRETAQDELWKSYRERFVELMTKAAQRGFFGRLLVKAKQLGLRFTRRKPVAKHDAPPVRAENSSERPAAESPSMVVIDKPRATAPEVMQAMFSRKATLEKDLFYITEEDLPAASARTDNEGVMLKARLVTMQNEMIGELIALEQTIVKARPFDPMEHPRDERGRFAAWRYESQSSDPRRYEKILEATKNLPAIKIGVPEAWKKLEIGELRHAVRRTLAGFAAAKIKVPHHQLVEIRFGGDGAGKSTSNRGGGGDRIKHLMVPSLPALLAAAKYHHSELPNEPAADPDVKDFHFLVAKVEIDGEDHSVLFNIRQKKPKPGKEEGRLYYNHRRIEVISPGMRKSAPLAFSSGKPPEAASERWRGAFAAGSEVAPGRLVIKSRPLHGRRWVDGEHMSIENRVGSVRHWTDQATGEKGRTTMKHPYGYVRRSLSVDGDQHDVFLGPLAHSDKIKGTIVYVVTTMEPPTFADIDEQKAMVGFESLKDAKAAFVAHYDDPRFIGQIDAVPWDEWRVGVRSTMHGGGLVRGEVVDRPMLKGRLLLKAHVKEYQRTTKTGDVVEVKEHDDKRQGAAPKTASPRPVAAVKPPSMRFGGARPAAPAPAVAAAPNPQEQPQQQAEPMAADKAISHDELGRYIESFRPVLKAALTQLSDLFPGARVGGRLKETASLAEKLVRKEKGLGDLEDIAGSRVEFDSIPDQLAAVDRIKRAFKVRTEDNYLEAPKGGVYRSYHFIVEVDGRPTEIQLRTARQTALADAMHDVTYKTHGKPAPPEAMPYFKQLADYFGCRDGGQSAGAECGQMPECPPPVKQISGCVADPREAA